MIIKKQLTKSILVLNIMFILSSLLLISFNDNFVSMKNNQSTLKKITTELYESEKSVYEEQFLKELFNFQLLYLIMNNTTDYNSYNLTDLYNNSLNKLTITKENLYELLKTDFQTDIDTIFTRLDYFKYYISIDKNTISALNYINELNQYIINNKLDDSIKLISDSNKLETLYTINLLNETNSTNFSNIIEILYNISK